MEGQESLDKVPSFIEKLQERFPGAEVREINLSEAPPDIRDDFESRSKLYILPEEYKPGNFEAVFLISYSEREEIYAAIQKKTYHNGKTEELIYVAEAINDKGVGRGEIRLAVGGANEKIPDYFLNKPFVGGTFTESELRGLGIGETRLRHMNEITRARYGLPLYSDTLIADSAKKIWARLIESGEAERFMEGDQERFKFKS